MLDAARTGVQNVLLSPESKFNCVVETTLCECVCPDESRRNSGGTHGGATEEAGLFISHAFSLFFVCLFLQ